MITFDYVAHTLTVELEDGTVTTYNDAQSYLADYPDRQADCIAVGWTI